MRHHLCYVLFVNYVLFIVICFTSSGFVCDRNRQQIQKWAYARIFPATLGPTLSSVIDSRVSFFGLTDALPSTVALAMLHFFPSHHVMCVLKTWLNGWTTSARMHDKVFSQCIFGCDFGAPDCLSHYVSCIRLWNYAHVASSHSSPPPPPDHSEWLCPSAPAERLCLSAPSPRSFVLLVVAFTTYHALRADLLSKRRLPSQAILDLRALELARAAWRKFDLPHFGTVVPVYSGL